MQWLLTKKNISLRVYYAAPEIRVTPVISATTDERLVGFLAKNEKLLASIFLSIAEPRDLPAQLVQYFEHRGWKVEHLEPSRTSD